MRYYYVPSTYRGYKFGSGIRAGAMKGLGALVGGSLSGGYAAAQVDISDLASKLPKDDQAKIAEAEATGKPADIGKDNFQLWSALKNDSGILWRKAKSGVSKLASAIGEQYDKLPQGVKTGINVGKSVGLFALGNPAIRKAILGFGYKGGMRLKKGSPEAKAYMARLRAMRRRRRGNGYSGGAMKGVSQAQMEQILQTNPTITIKRKDGDYPGYEIPSYVNKAGQTVNYRVPKVSLEKMIIAGQKLAAQRARIQAMDKNARSAYFIEHYRKGQYKKPEYKNMTQKRFDILFNKIRYLKNKNRIIDSYRHTKKDDNGKVIRTNNRVTDKWIEKWINMPKGTRHPGAGNWAKALKKAYKKYGRKKTKKEMDAEVRNNPAMKAALDKLKNFGKQDPIAPAIEDFSDDDGPVDLDIPISDDDEPFTG